MIANVWFHFDLRADVAGMGLKNWPFMNANLFEVALALMFWIQFQSHALRLVCPGRSFRLKMEVIWKQRNSDSLRDRSSFQVLSALVMLNRFPNHVSRMADLCSNLD